MGQGAGKRFHDCVVQWKRRALRKHAMTNHPAPVILPQDRDIHACLTQSDTHWHTMPSIRHRPATHPVQNAFQPQSRGHNRYPIPNMSLSRLNLILIPSVLALASPAWAEARQSNAKTSQPRPLNLSLPRDVLSFPDTAPVDETVQRNLSAPVPVPQNGTPGPAQLRYGTGYEHRHQEMGGAPAGGSAGAGAGRRGR